MASALVVVSHYNAWPTDKLVALLDQMEAIPSGHPFSVRIVVNQAEPKPLELPARHAGIEVLYRENTGYNIGAWDFGWKEPPKFDFYLFLQEECVIRRPGWLKAYLRALARPGVGLVGESLSFKMVTWDGCSRDPYSYWNWAEVAEGEERPVDWTVVAREFLTRQGVDHGESVEHLQSLVLCAPIGVLEGVGHFRIGLDYHEAMAAEVGISKSVESLGLKVRQVGIRPFEYILHPQWEKLRAESASPRWWYRLLKLEYRRLRASSSREGRAVASR